MSTVSKRTILVAEDDNVILGMLRQALSLEGYQLELARDGQETIDILARDPGKERILLLDLRMPNVDGWAVVRWLVEHRDIKTKTKIVLMSANELLQQASDLEHDAELRKPLDMDSLLNILESLM